MAENKRLTDENLPRRVDEFPRRVDKSPLKGLQTSLEGSTPPVKGRKFPRRVDTSLEGSTDKKAIIVLRNINFPDKPLWFPYKNKPYLENNEWTDGRGYFYRTDGKVPVHIDILFLSCLLLETYRQNSREISVIPARVLEFCFKPKNGNFYARLLESLEDGGE